MPHTVNVKKIKHKFWPFKELKNPFDAKMKFVEGFCEVSLELRGHAPSAKEIIDLCHRSGCYAPERSFLKREYRQEQSKNLADASEALAKKRSEAAARRSTTNTASTAKPPENKVPPGPDPRILEAVQKNTRLTWGMLLDTSTDRLQYEVDAVHAYLEEKYPEAVNNIRVLRKNGTLVFKTQFNGEEVKTVLDKDGIISLNIPASSQRLTVEDTPT